MSFDIRSAALVIIDLQKGIVRARNGADVVEKARKLVDVFRADGGFIAFVHVDFLDSKDKPAPLTDNPPQTQPNQADWAEFVPELGVMDTDYTVTKRSWGAFYGTDLDIQLRRRGIKNIVLCGISTNMGVESTAREAFARGYDQVFITDAMKAFTEAEHNASCEFVFPKLGRVRTLESFLSMIK